MATCLKPGIGTFSLQEIWNYTKKLVQLSQEYHAELRYKSGISRAETLNLAVPGYVIRSSD